MQTAQGFFRSLLRAGLTNAAALPPGYCDSTTRAHPGLHNSLGDAIASRDRASRTRRSGKPRLYCSVLGLGDSSRTPM